MEELLEIIWTRLIQAQRFFSKPNLLPGDGNLTPLAKRRYMATVAQRCVQCDSRENLTVDHILARSMGGRNHRNNFQVLCVTCNQKKSTIEKQLLRKLKTKEFRDELKALFLAQCVPRAIISQAKRAKLKVERDAALALIAAKVKAGVYKDDPIFSYNQQDQTLTKNLEPNGAND